MKEPSVKETLLSPEQIARTETLIAEAATFEGYLPLLAAHSHILASQAVARGATPDVVIAEFAAQVAVQYKALSGEMRRTSH